MFPSNSPSVSHNFFPEGGDHLDSILQPVWFLLTGTLSNQSGSNWGQTKSKSMIIMTPWSWLRYHIELYCNKWTMFTESFRVKALLPVDLTSSGFIAVFFFFCVFFLRAWERVETEKGVIYNLPSSVDFLFAPAGSQPTADQELLWKRRPPLKHRGRH